MARSFIVFYYRKDLVNWVGKCPFSKSKYHAILQFTGILQKLGILIKWLSKCKRQRHFAVTFRECVHICGCKSRTNQSSIPLNNVLDLTDKKQQVKCTLFNFRKSLRAIHLSTYLVCNIINDYNPVSSAIVARCDGSESLLACRIPLQKQIQSYSI